MKQKVGSEIYAISYGCAPKEYRCLFVKIEEIHIAERDVFVRVKHAGHPEDKRFHDIRGFAKKGNGNNPLRREDFVTHRRVIRD